LRKFKRFLAGLNDVFSKASADETVFVYLAGHGTVSGSSFFFLPHDVDVHDIENSSVPLTTIKSLFDGCKSRRVFLWMDFCHSGGIFARGSQGDVPYGWDCGVLFDQTTGTLLCGDLFTQPGAETPPVTESEILTASKAMRKPMDYYAHSTRTTKILERLASLNPTTIACQHGSAYRGDGAALLRELAAILEKELRAELA